MVFRLSKEKEEIELQGKVQVSVKERSYGNDTWEKQKVWIFEMQCAIKTAYVSFLRCQVPGLVPVLLNLLWKERGHADVIYGSSEREKGTVSLLLNWTQLKCLYTHFYTAPLVLSNFRVYTGWWSVLIWNTFLQL